MAINLNYTNQTEYERGLTYGTEEATRAFDLVNPKTRSELYEISINLFNDLKKKLKNESDSFVAGVDTALQTVFQNRWESMDSASIFSNAIYGRNHSDINFNSKDSPSLGEDPIFRKRKRNIDL